MEDFGSTSQDDEFEKVDNENVDNHEKPENNMDTPIVPGKDNIQDSVDDFSETISTDEIIKMYENVEFDMNKDRQITTDEILKMYDDENSVQNPCVLKKSTRKLKQNKP